jgi:hypothetical protein
VSKTYPKGAQAQNDVTLTIRHEYGPRMEKAFRDLRRESLRRGGGIWLSRFWVRVGLDLATTPAAVERS